MFFCFSPLLSSQFIITQMVDMAHQMILSRYHEIFRYGFILFHWQYSEGQFNNLTPYLMIRVVWLAGIAQQLKLAHALHRLLRILFIVALIFWNAVIFLQPNIFGDPHILGFLRLPHDQIAKATIFAPSEVCNFSCTGTSVDWQTKIQ